MADVLALIIIFQRSITMIGKYKVQMEVSAPTAMFTRPDSGSAAVSYPAPPRSAVRGMFEAVGRWKSAYVEPEKVEICRPIQFGKYTTNYGGPLRKANQMTKDSPYQLRAVVLVNVCYRLYGVVREYSPSPGSYNHLHAYQEMLLRRIERGQSYRGRVCLGWSEFLADYVGPFREATRIQEDLNLEIPSLLWSVYAEPFAQPTPVFKNNQRVINGVLSYVA